jgi:hypothetical protein
MKPQSLGDSAAFGIDCRVQLPGIAQVNPMVCLLPDFSVANRPQGSYTLGPRRTVFSPGARSAWPFPEIDEDRGTCADFRESQMRHISPPRRVFGPVYRAERRAGNGSHLGRGRMTTGSTKPDAKHVSACAFVIARPPVDRLVATSRCALGALSLNPTAAHGAPQRSPARRVRSVGARRPGAHFNGYQKNAGGWHPPGRNTDRRQQR